MPGGFLGPARCTLGFPNSDLVKVKHHLPLQDVIRSAEPLAVLDNNPSILHILEVGDIGAGPLDGLSFVVHLFWDENEGDLKLQTRDGSCLFQEPEFLSPIELFLAVKAAGLTIAELVQVAPRSLP